MKFVIAETFSAARISDCLALRTNQSEQQLACAERSLEFNLEVPAGCNLLEVKERSSRPEKLFERVIKSAGVSSSVIAPVADENHREMLH
jgi:hypothetical protein